MGNNPMSQKFSFLSEPSLRGGGGASGANVLAHCGGGGALEHWYMKL